MYSRTSRYICKKHGFTMLEMAVSLAVMAAIAAVIFGGGNLINKARVSAVVDQFRVFGDGIEKFDSKYGGLPGDLADVSKIPGAVAGNGDGVIDAAEALDVWQQLSLAGLIQGKYDASSANSPGVGVPAGSFAESGYNIVTSGSGFESQAVVIEFAGFDSSSNDLAILVPDDAEWIDQKLDDGNPNTGKVRGVEGSGMTNQCIAGGAYNVANGLVSCRVRFVISGGSSIGNAPNITDGGTDPCDKMGLTRESDATSDICPVGYVGKVMETCRIDSDNEGNWEITSRNCEPITCSGGGKYGDKRSLACINGMTGTGITQTCGVAGVWTIGSSDCVLPDGVTACSPNNVVRDPQACDWGKEGGVKQTCTSGTWSTDSGGDSCAAIKCDAQNIGATKSVSCVVANKYSGMTVQVCGVDGVWRSTSIGSACAPVYNFNCTEGSTANRDVGCPVGEVGEHWQECIATNRWATVTDSCVPVTCGGENIGTARVKEGAVCANDKNGVVMEVCHSDGSWVEVANNCAKNMCKGNADNLGFAVWPNTSVSSNGTGACVAGYKVSGSAPTRACNADGSWSSSISNPCVIDQCPAVGSYWPATNRGVGDVVGRCSWPKMEGRPLRDCNISAVWDNERYRCQASAIASTDGLSVWFDAADAATIFEDTGCNDEAEIGDGVACWKDKSGNALNLTESTAGRRPLYIDNGRNMRSILRFDGTDDRMTRASVSGSSLGTAEEVTLFVAYEYTNKSGADYNSNVAYWASANGRFNFIGIYSNALFYWDYGTTGGVSTTRMTAASSNFMDSFNIVSVDRRVDDTSSIWVNGAHVDKEYSKTDAFLVGESATLQVMQGASGYTKGDMGELIVYKRQMSDVERAAVEGYLMDKWNVSALPVSKDVSLWLDAADADTMYLESACTNKVSASGNTVGCWRDKSGNGLNVTQGTAANEPAYITNVENGRSILRFDGTNDGMATANVAASSLGGPNSVTAFVAYQYDSAVHDAAVLYFTEGSTNRFNVYGIWSNSLFYFDYGTTGSSAATRTSFTPVNFMDMFQVVALDRQKDGTSGIWINGVKRFSEGGKTDEFSGMVATTALNVGSTGGSSWLDGDIGEVIIYKAGLNDDDRGSVEDYLMDKWGVAGVVPVSDSMTLWLDAADTDTMYLESGCTNRVSGSGNTVGCWKDKSGNGLDVTQGTAANEPAYIVNGQNDLSVLRFDGVNDALVKSNVLGSSLGAVEEVTLLLAYRYDSPLHNSVLVSWEGSGDRMRLYGVWGDSGLYWDYGQTGNRRTNTTIPDFVDKFNVVSVDRRLDDISTIWLNGVSRVVSTGRDSSFGTDATDGLDIANADGSYFMKGDVGEILLYKRALTAVERVSVEGYLLDKWGVSVLPVADDVTFWVDAADAGSVHESVGCDNVAESGDGVGCWRDKSGQGLDVIQSVAASRPEYVKSGQNDKAVIRFDGVDDKLSKAGVVGNTIGAAEEITIFVAYKQHAPEKQSVVLNWMVNGYLLRLLGLWDNGYYYWDYGHQDETRRIAPTPPDFMDKFQIITVDRRLYDVSSMWINGEMIFSGGNRDSAFVGSAAYNWDVGHMNGFYHLRADMGEIIIYDREMPDLQRASIEGYLSDKWGVPVREYELDLPVRDSVNLWLDGSDPNFMYLDSGCTNKVSASGNTVGCWKDKSGSWLDVKQNTAANEPTYVVGGRNGRSVLRFDGTNDVLTRTNVVGSRVGAGHEITAFAAYEYMNKSGSDYNSNLLFWLATGRMNLIGIYGNGLVYWDYGANCCGADSRTSFTPSNYMDNFNVLSVDRRVDDTSQIWVNGVLLKSEGSKTSVFPEGETATFEVGHGSSGYTKADIGDLIIYKREMSDIERRSVEEHLMDKWGINPLPVTGVTDLKLWLDASDVGSVHEATGCNDVAEYGDAVACLQDKSGNGLNVTQNTAANRPLYVKDVQSDRSIIRFDGSNDGLTRANVGGSSLALAQEVTLFVAYEYDSPLHNSALLFWQDGNNRLGVFGLYDAGKFYWDFGVVGANSRTSWTSSNYTDVFNIVSMDRRLNDKSTIWVNGVAVATATGLNSAFDSGGNDDIDIGNIDGGSYLKGDVGEIIIYDREFKQSERVGVERYLADKWNVGVNHLPSMGNMIIWLDASNKEHLYSDTGCVTNIAASGDKVGCWRDISGGGKHATQSVLTKRPTYQPLVQNGRSTVRLDASDDGMVTSLGHNSGAYTAGVVFNYRSGTSAARRAIQGGPSGTGPNWLIGPYSNKVAHFANGWVANTVSVSTVQNQFYVAVATNSGSASNFYVDGVLKVNSSSPVGMPNDLCLGASGRFGEPLDGDIAEVIMYNVVLSAESRGSLEGYLGDKWGINVQ